jgi:hypothetical protein
MIPTNSFTAPGGIQIPAAALLKNLGQNNTQAAPFTMGQNAAGFQAGPFNMGQNNQGGFLSGIGGLEGLGSIAQGIASLGQVFAAIQGTKIAKEQLALSKEAYQTNLANTTKTYNTALEDRIKARTAMQSGTADDVSSYLSKNSL